MSGWLLVILSSYMLQISLLLWETTGTEKYKAGHNHMISEYLIFQQRCTITSAAPEGHGKGGRGGKRCQGEGRRDWRENSIQY